MMNARRCAAGMLALVAVCTAAAGAPTETGGKVRPGDLLYVDVYRVPEMSRAYPVGEDGLIRMPYISPVEVGGLDEKAAGASITKALESILRGPRVTVSRSNIGMTSTLVGRASDMRLETIPLRNSNAESMALALKGMASPGGSVSADPDTNSLLLTDKPEAIKNMMSVIARIDQMQSQVTQVRIETKVAEVRSGAMKELGVRWFAQGKNFGGGFVPPAKSLSSLGDLNGGLGPQANEFPNRNTGSLNNNNPNQRDFVGSGFDRRLNIPVTIPTPGQTFLGYAAGGVDIGAMIDALVTDRKAKLLADPTIVTVNHKPAQIKMVDEYPYLEFGTEITGRSISSVKFMELGINLGVTPHVYQDAAGTYVKLDLHPEVSFPSGVANGVPIRSLRSSNTIANVRDGQTLVVGGIITEDEQNAVTKVPGIGDMPIFGNLFKTREKTKFRTELMIFVTPTVHRRPEEITWDRMIDVAEGLNEQNLAPGDTLRQEARKE